MATPRGVLSFPLFAGSGEQSIAASVPTLGGAMYMRVQSGSVIWTDQPTTLASLLTASNGMLMCPVDGVFTYYGNPANLRFRDCGAGAVVVISFYESAGLGGVGL
jgi:hypothetical protein